MNKAGEIKIMHRRFHQEQKIQLSGGRASRFSLNRTFQHCNDRVWIRVNYRQCPSQLLSKMSMSFLPLHISEDTAQWEGIMLFIIAPKWK